MALLLVVVPLCFALLAFLVRSDRTRPRLVTVGGMVQLLLAALALRQPHVEGLNGWLLLDPIGRIVLGFTTVLFAACSVYVPGYLGQRPERPNRIFCACVLAF